MTAVVCFDLLADAVSPDGGRLWLAVPGILLGCGTTGVLNAWIGQKNGSGQGLFLAGLVLFKGREFREEMGKNLHI